MTKVVFRKFGNGEVIAVFPQEKWNGRDLTSYIHIGQHGACSPQIASITKPATPEEYAPLLQELQSIGYDDLRVMKKIV